MHYSFVLLILTTAELALFADTGEFEDVLAQWESGEFAQLHPSIACPFNGLMATIAFSTTKAETLQSQLIGMSEQQLLAM
eukprot:SAG31_NODE_474_length_15176_cov_7.362340_4_plen_80_part_00